MRLWVDWDLCHVGCAASLLQSIHMALGWASCLLATCAIVCFASLLVLGAVKFPGCSCLDHPISGWVLGNGAAPFPSCAAAAVTAAAANVFAAHLCTFPGLAGPKLASFATLSSSAGVVSCVSIALHLTFLLCFLDEYGIRCGSSWPCMIIHAVHVA